MIIAMCAHATKPDAPPKLICLMMSGRGRCPHLRRPDKRGSTVHGQAVGGTRTVSRISRRGVDIIKCVLGSWRG